MVPKFRGGSDDWLDDQSSRRGAKAAGPKKIPRPSYLAQEEANALVVEVYPKQCRIRLDEDKSEFLCSYRRANVITVLAAGKEYRERSPVAVGDRVKALRTSPSSGVIEGLVERRNFLSRPAPGRGEESSILHVIAANIDRLLVVASVQEPQFTPGLVDRFLVAASAAGIPVFICVNKVDLNPGAGAKPWELYTAIGYPVLEVCAKSGRGIPELVAALREGKTVLAGQSGVGKTSILQTVLGTRAGRIGEISQATQKGRHTTTSSVMIENSLGLDWIDTPGVKEFGLAHVAPEELKNWFPEFASIQCENADCMHSEEPGCRARELARYPSYRRMYDSLRSGEN